MISSVEISSLILQRLYQILPGNERENEQNITMEKYV